MPVRSLSSSVLKWPDADQVVQALRKWAGQAVRERRGITRIGYFGSYARNEEGVGSDLDVVVVVKSSEEPFERRSVKWDVSDLPVPADVLVYTENEWKSGVRENSFFQTLERDVVWLYKAEAGSRQ